MLHCCAKQRGIKLLNDLPATASRTETPSAKRKRPAEDEAVPPPSKRIRMAQNEPPIVFACRVFRKLAEDGKLAAQARACRRVVTESPADDLLLASYEYEAGVCEVDLAEDGKISAAQARACRHVVTESAANDLLLASYEYEAGVSEADVLATICFLHPTIDQYRRTEAASTSRKRPAEDEAVPPPSKRIRMAHNEPPVVFACRVFRQLAEDGKISAAQARACRRVMTKSAANDLVLASYEYEAGVNEADVLAAINRVVLPPRPLARRVAEFVKEELKRQTLRSVCAYAFKAGVNAAAVVVLNRLTKE
ncbi:hypothetical protein HDU90_003072 [Geranomyces variabilis]|nr:hypothetical protein HDU90_003072 [Geranomyces variabilis]